MSEELKVKQEILKEQVEERREAAKQVWKIYIEEMTRLIENPSSQPDVSALERFIKENECSTFSCDLALVFKDAIEFGVGHAGFVAENHLME